MSNVNKLEKEILALPPTEREYLALAAWESLEAQSGKAKTLPDQEGITLAQQRDTEFRSGSVKPLSHSEFLRHTTPDSAE